MNAQSILMNELAKRRTSVAAQARVIGVSQPFWNMVVLGKRNPGQRTLNRIRGVYPDLASLAIAALLDGGN